MSKKYQRIWKRIEELYSGSPEKNKNQYYKRVLNDTLLWTKTTGINRNYFIKMVLRALGKECRYCKRILTAKNNDTKISLDHKRPTFRDGTDEKGNLEIICSRCNRRKGILTSWEYGKLLSFLDWYVDDAQKYILRKLGMKDKF